MRYDLMGFSPHSPIASDLASPNMWRSTSLPWRGRRGAGVHWLVRAETFAPNDNKKADGKTHDTIEEHNVFPARVGAYLRS